MVHKLEILTYKGGEKYSNPPPPPQTTASGNY